MTVGDVAERDILEEHQVNHWSMQLISVVVSIGSNEFGLLTILRSGDDVALTVPYLKRALLLADSVLTMLQKFAEPELTD